MPSHGAAPRARLLFAAIVLSLAAMRLWLGFGLRLTLAWTPHDDLLFVALAHLVRQGDWLGQYTNLTLIKGPFYPLFIAGASATGIRLIAAEQILYVAACALLVWALFPFLPGRWFRLVAFALLAFDPVSLSTDAATRALREGIYPALTLAVFATAIGVGSRMEEPIGRRLLWAGGLGLSLSALWLTREEGIWIVPSVVLLLGLALLESAAPLAARCTRLLLSVGVAGAVFASCLGAVIATNCSRYGVCAITEFGESWFSESMRSLERVKGAGWRQYLLVPREARARVYSVSPSFRELQPFLEGDLGRHWIRFGSCPALGICDDLGGSWVVWAVRDAVAAHGYYDGGATSVAAYYLRLGSEIENACLERRLDCGPPGHSILPPWRRDYVVPALLSFSHGLVSLSALQDVTVGSAQQRLPPELEALYDVTGEETAAVETAPIRDTMAADLATYRHAVPLLSVAALALYVLATVRMVRSRLVSGGLVVATAVIVAVVVRLLMLSLIDVTSAPVIKVVYMAPLYPLVPLFAVLCIGAFVHRRPQAAGS